MWISHAFKVQPLKEHVCKQMHAVINSEKEVCEKWLEFCFEGVYAVEVLASLKVLVPGNLTQEISWVTFLISPVPRLDALDCCNAGGGDKFVHHSD